MSNYRELEAKFKQYRSRVTRGTEAAMRKTAAKMTKDMRENVPVDTGALRGSIRYSVSKATGEIVVRIHANAQSAEGTKYAEFIEFGTGIYNQHGDGRKTPWVVSAVVHGVPRTWTTHGMVAHPFIRPAFRKYLPELQKSIQRTMRVDGIGPSGW